ncbi:MAG: transglutaminase domain-containing protein [Sedimentisphaerales bacterium]
MKRFTVISIAVLVLTCVVSHAKGNELADECFKNMPYGCFVNESIVAPRDQTAAIAKRLGASIEKLSNTYLTVHGTSIQVNLLDAATEADAAKLYTIISNMKGHPAFCLRIKKRVVEFVGNDPALAIKTSYELGFLKKPGRIRYRITAQISTIDKADYMSFNKLFNMFLSTDSKNSGKEVVSEITRLSKGFQFGTSLTMRSPDLGKLKAVYEFTPAPYAKKPAGDDMVIYLFRNPPRMMGVPYVTAAIEITTDETGCVPTTRKAGQTLLSSTEFFPSNDQEVIAHAAKITKGKRTTEDKVRAILEWLAPGRNIKFGGPVTGSRCGVKKVLKQKFGQCWDFSDCFITLSRASGVPCRQVGGWLYGSSGHIWAEYLDVGKGWKQVDATGAGKLNCGIYHIPFFTSETGEMPILYVSMPTIEIVETK